MKTYEELKDRYHKVIDQLDVLFGCEYGGDLFSLLFDLSEFVESANSIIEDSKVVGTYDAVLHKRDKEELESILKENKRLRGLLDIGIAVKYMKSIYNIGDESFYGINTRWQADNQLKDRVREFLALFKEDN